MSVVIAAGTVALATSVYQQVQRPPAADFYYLAVLTALSALLPVRLHRAYASISVSETFIFSATLLHGPAAGTILVSLDAMLIWLMLSSGGIRWNRLFFSVASSAFAMWVSGMLLFRIIGGTPFVDVPVGQRPDIWLFAGGLIAATGAYFLLNSWLVALAIALEQRVGALEVWIRNFTTLAPNYLAAASLAGLLVYNANGIPLAFLLFIVPPLVVLLTTYRVATRRLLEAEEHVVKMKGLADEVQAANAELQDTLDRLRRTQAQLIQSEKLSAVGLLAAGVAHEVNNPLTSIGLFAEALQQDLSGLNTPSGQAQELAEMATNIMAESERAAKIVRNLLVFSRQESGRREPQDVAELCGRVLELRAFEQRKKGVAVARDFALDLPLVLMDAGQIQQVFLNLMANAERAMQESATKKLSIAVRADSDSGTVLITVADTGHGIDPAYIQRVFDPFFTTRPPGEGTGLGTSLAYGIVRDHGGEITVESQVSVGTTFTVRLPYLLRRLAEAAPRPVLVACHDSTVLDYLTAVLKAWGFEALKARSAAEALETLAAAKPGFVVACPSVIEQDLSGWQAAWEAGQSRTDLIAVRSDDADVGPGTQQFLRATARSTIVLPCSHRQIREAIGVVPEALQ